MRIRKLYYSACFIVVVSLSGLALAQRGLFGPPPLREHSITHAGELHPVPATQQPPGSNEVSIEITGADRVIRANGIPDHRTGQFPNRGNPNRIAEQSYSYRVPAEPQIAQHTTPAAGQSFGIAVNGVPFDPGAAEVYQGNPQGGWHYEPLSGAVPLGIDTNHAHVQPTGAYHYHGLPTDLLKSLKVDGTTHSPIIGWAADGFPIYAIYGYTDPKSVKTPVKVLKSSYRIKAGNRPGGDLPDGTYDGTFVADYEYVAGHGDLDACNGRECVTPEYPEGTYAYFLTEDWPVIPREYRGTPSPDFRRGPPPGRRGSPGGSFGPPPGR